MKISPLVIPTKRISRKLSISLKGSMSENTGQRLRTWNANGLFKAIDIRRYIILPISQLATIFLSIIMTETTENKLTSSKLGKWRLTVFTNNLVVEKNFVTVECFINKFFQKKSLSKAFKN